MAMAHLRGDKPLRRLEAVRRTPSLHERSDALSVLCVRVGAELEKDIDDAHLARRRSNEECRGALWVGLHVGCGQIRAWKGMEGRGRAWKGVEGHGRAWKGMAAHGSAMEGHSSAMKAQWHGGGPGEIV